MVVNADAVASAAFVFGWLQSEGGTKLIQRKAISASLRTSSASQTPKGHLVGKLARLRRLQVRRGPWRGLVC